MTVIEKILMIIIVPTILVVILYIAGAFVTWQWWPETERVSHGILLILRIVWVSSFVCGIITVFDK